MAVATDPCWTTRARAYALTGVDDATVKKLRHAAETALACIDADPSPDGPTLTPGGLEYRSPDGRTVVSHRHPELMGGTIDRVLVHRGEETIADLRVLATGGRLSPPAFGTDDPIGVDVRARTRILIETVVFHAAEASKADLVRLVMDMAGPTAACEAASRLLVAEADFDLNAWVAMPTPWTGLMATMPERSIAPAPAEPGPLSSAAIAAIGTTLSVHQPPFTTARSCDLRVGPVWTQVRRLSAVERLRILAAADDAA